MAKPEQDGAERRRFDPERTRQAILAAAREEFAAHGLSGARVDAIAGRTNTVKRMIYYYFGSKDGLYLAVLEQAFADIRRSENELGLDVLDPVAAITRLVEFTFDYHEAHPDFIRLVSAENINCAEHLKRSKIIQEQNHDALRLLERVMERGKRLTLFRPDAEPLDIHLMITSLCFFRISNRHTFGLLFGPALSTLAARRRQRRGAVDAVLNALAASRSLFPREARAA